MKHNLSCSTWIAATLASLVVFASGDASACSGGLCAGGFSLPAAGAVPASLPAVLWLPRTGEAANLPGPADVSLFAMSAAGDTPVAVTVEPAGTNPLSYLVKPDAALLPDTDYVLRSKDGCDPSAPSITTSFVTTDAVPLPTTLGAVLVTDQGYQTLQVSTVSGSCTASQGAATAAVSLSLSAEAAPWANVLFYETIVDGKPWHAANSLLQQLPPGESWKGRGLDMLYMACGNVEPGVDPGLQGLGVSHTITIRATIPGTSVTLESEPSSISMGCPGIDYVDPPGDASGDCSVAPGRVSRSSSGLLLVLGGLAFFLGRRRVNRP